MKLSNILLEIKRIGIDQDMFSVPVYRPNIGNINLRFTERKIDFKLDKNTNKLSATSTLWTKAGSKSDSALSYYLAKEKNVDSFRKNIVNNYKKNTEGFADIVNSDKRLMSLPLPRLLQFLEKQYKVDITKLIAGPSSESPKSRDQYFLRTSTFSVDTSDVDYKSGIYIWVIDGEMRYVGLTSDIKDRPNKNYGITDGWNVVFGTTGNRMNAYITARLEKETNPKNFNKIIRVFTAEITPTPEDRQAASTAQGATGNGYGSFKKYFREQVLARVEGQVKAWTANLTSGKVDQDGMEKPKTPGRGTYGRSGDLNKADIKQKK
jgi:hypothetical protein